MAPITGRSRLPNSLWDDVNDADVFLRIDFAERAPQRWVAPIGMTEVPVAATALSA